MIIGENNKPGDLVVNPNEGKKLTNMRASTSEELRYLERRRRP